MARRLGLAVLVFISAATAGFATSIAAGSTRPASAQLAAASTVGCTKVIGQQASGSADGSRVEFGVISVPPPRLQRGAGSGVSAWKYFIKWGMGIHSGASVTVSVPRAWRARVAVTWGASTPIVSTLRFAACHSAGGRAQPWNEFPGGFYIDTPTACVPLTITAGQRSRTVRFGIGQACS